MYRPWWNVLNICSWPTYFSGSGLSTLACSQMMGSTPSNEKQHLRHNSRLNHRLTVSHTCRHSCTCWGVLQQLFELCWSQLRACDRHGHSNLCELDLDVGLLQETEERGGGNPLGGAISSALHHVNDHLSPERQKTVQFLHQALGNSVCVQTLTGHLAGLWHHPHWQWVFGCFPGLCGETPPAAAAALAHQLLFYWEVRPLNHPHPYWLEHSCSPLPRRHKTQTAAIRYSPSHEPGSASDLSNKLNSAFHLEPAEGVFLGEVHRWVVVAVETLPCAPVSLQLVPFGQDGVTLISQQRGSWQSSDLLVKVGGLSLALLLGLLAEQASWLQKRRGKFTLCKILCLWSWGKSTKLNKCDFET